MFDRADDNARTERVKPFLPKSFGSPEVTNRSGMARVGEFALSFMNAEVKQLHWITETSTEFPWN